MPSTTTPITSSSTTTTTGIATAAAGTLSPTNTEGLKKAVGVAAIHTNNRHVYYCQKATPGKLHT